MKYIFWVLYRVWFYVLIAFTIIVLFPVLTLSVLKDRWYPYFFKIARLWARIIIFGMGFKVKVKHHEFLVPNNSYILIANHTSMLDIMTMLRVANTPFVFVGKKELAKLPVFGYFYKRTSILVDRNSVKSRQAVYRQAQQCIKKGYSICIFPEGRVPQDESIVLDTFKEGAFKLALNHKIPIVPIVFLDNKKRFSYTLFSGSPGILRVKMLDFITVEKPGETAITLRDKSHKVIFDALNSFKGKEHKKT